MSVSERCRGLSLKFYAAGSSSPEEATTTGIRKAPAIAGAFLMLVNDWRLGSERKKHSVNPVGNLLVAFIDIDLAQDHPWIGKLGCLVA